MGENLLLPQMDRGLVLRRTRDSLLQFLLRERKVSERLRVADSNIREKGIEEAATRIPSLR